MKDRPQSTKIKWLIEPRFDVNGVQISSGIAVDGREYPDNVPMAPPVGYEAPTALETLIEQVVRRRDFERAVEAAGGETFEEADDFEVDEDYDPRFEETIYEAYFEAKSRRQAAMQQQADAPSGPGTGSNSGSRTSGDLAPERVVDKPSGKPDKSLGIQTSATPSDDVVEK